MTSHLRLLFLSLFTLGLAASLHAATTQARPLPAELRGDFDPNHPPGRLRVLVGLGASSFFYRQGRPHGVEYAMLLELEKFMNRGRSAKSGLIKLQLIPMESGEVLSALQAGQGDLAVGLLPALESARSLVAFSHPYLQDRWCLVGRGGPLPRLDEMGERPLAIPRPSLGNALLTQENTRRLRAGKPILEIQDMPRTETTETVLAGIQKGSGQLSLASRYQIGLWSRVMPNLRVGECLSETVPVSWAVRKETPALKSYVDRFLMANPELSRRAAELTYRHLALDGKAAMQVQAMDGPEKLAFFAPVFQMVGQVYEIDWLLLAAIGQQETTLRHVVSRDGPTGVMQVNPATARQMGVKDPHNTEQNITAAARYLHYLRELYNRPSISPDDQMAFMLAAYNAGEGRLQQIRRQTAEEGLDPNRWAGNVERLARRMVGSRLTYYVGAVGRYYRDFKKIDRSEQVLPPEPTPVPGQTMVAVSPIDLF